MMNKYWFVLHIDRCEGTYKVFTTPLDAADFVLNHHCHKEDMWWMNHKVRDVIKSQRHEPGTAVKLEKGTWGRIGTTCTRKLPWWLNSSTPCWQFYDCENKGPESVKSLELIYYLKYIELFISWSIFYNSIWGMQGWLN